MKWYLLFQLPCLHRTFLHTKNICEVQDSQWYDSCAFASRSRDVKTLQLTKFLRSSRLCATFRNNRCVDAYLTRSLADFFAENWQCIHPSFFCQLKFRPASVVGNLVKIFFTSNLCFFAVKRIHKNTSKTRRFLDKLPHTFHIVFSRLRVFQTLFCPTWTKRQVFLTAHTKRAFCSFGSKIVMSFAYLGTESFRACYVGPDCACSWCCCVNVTGVALFSPERAFQTENLHEKRHRNAARRSWRKRTADAATSAVSPAFIPYKAFHLTSDS